jgi:hypothetical protein
MNRFTKVAAAACALAFSATSAFAASSASASISNLQFQVIDLMPADGVTNFYATNSLGVSMSVSALDGSAGTNENHTYNRNSGLFTFSKSTSVDADTAQGQAAVNAKGMSVSGSSTGPQTSFSGSIQSNGSSGWPYYYSGSLTLSAHSVLIVTADALVQASATNPSACDASYYYCNSTEQANASAFMNLNYAVQGQAGSTSGSSSNSVGVNASARGEYSYQTHTDYDWSQPDWYNHPIYQTITVPKSEQTFEQAAKFYAVFTNTSDIDQLANFVIGVSVNGNASTGLSRSAGGLSAVPEADSLALAMVGLMTAGTMLRRRRHG